MPGATKGIPKELRTTFGVPGHRVSNRDEETVKNRRLVRSYMGKAVLITSTALFRRAGHTGMYCPGLARSRECAAQCIYRDFGITMDA
jgi:hypothetical protein